MVIRKDVLLVKIHSRQDFGNYAEKQILNSVKEFIFVEILVYTTYHIHTLLFNLNLSSRAPARFSFLAILDVEINSQSN